MNTLLSAAARATPPNEHRVVFPTPLAVEGLLYPVSGDQGVVITHPHPLHGGNMHDAVVAALARAYQQAGYTTLRFNFRGVGRSQGHYTWGRGEQEDVKAALVYLAQQGKTRLDLAGYSFGAWVNARVRPTQETVQRMIMVSPAVVFPIPRPLPSLPQLKLVIAAGRDLIAPPAILRAMLAVSNPTAQVEIIRGARHFYWGHVRKLEALLTAYLAASAQ